MEKEKRNAFKEAIENMSMFTVKDTDEGDFELQFKKKDGTVLSQIVETETYSDLMRNLGSLQCIRPDEWLKDWINELKEDKLLTVSDIKQMMEDADLLWTAYQDAYHGVFWKNNQMEV